MSPPSLESQLATEGIDLLLGRIESAEERVRKVQGSRVKLNKAEVDLLTHLERARDVMLFGLRKGDRSVLQEVFGGDCRRIARLRALVEAVQLSDMYKDDQRLPTCLRAIKSVEDVLKDLGHEHVLKEAEEAAKTELEKKQHAEEEEADPLLVLPLTETQDQGTAGESTGNRAAACKFEVTPVTPAADVAANEAAGVCADPAAVCDGIAAAVATATGQQGAACDFRVSHEDQTKSAEEGGVEETRCEFSLAATARKPNAEDSTCNGEREAACDFVVAAQEAVSPPVVGETHAGEISSADADAIATGTDGGSAVTPVIVTPTSLSSVVKTDCAPSPQPAPNGVSSGKAAHHSATGGYSIANATVGVTGAGKGAGYAPASIRTSLRVPAAVSTVRPSMTSPASSAASTPRSSSALERLVRGNGMEDKPEERKQVIVKGFQTGELKALTYQIFSDTAAPKILLDWNSGKIALFITRVFERLKLQVPTSSEMYALYTRFDADGNWALDVEEGARLIESAICSLCGIESSGHRNRLVLAVQSGEVEQLAVSLFATHDAQRRGELYWATGEAAAFIRDVFRSLKAPEPSDVQIETMQRSFDSSGTGILHEQQAIVLVETLCRSLSHVESADQAMTCPSGHVMQIFSTPIAGYSCDMCKSTFRESIALWECRACDYHMCTVCAKQRRRRLPGTPA